MAHELLFSPFTLGPTELTSRIVMAPMTRSRSPNNVPDDLVATYYGQRASAGLIRKAFTGAVILSGGYTDADGAEKALADKKGELVAYARTFLANPTLPAKLKTGAKLTEPDMATFYTPGPKGYTDYPA